MTAIVVVTRTDILCINNFSFCTSPRRCPPRLSCAISHNSSNPVLFGTRAEVLLKMGRIEETLEDAEEALGINDRYPQAHRIRGECLMKMGDYSNAVESLEISLALDEHDLETQCLLKLAKKQESSQLIGPCVSNSSINEEGAAPNVAAAANRRTTVKNNPNKRWWCVKEDIIQDKSEQLTGLYMIVSKY
mmetsp:Transcript_37949/g.60944  ORF Transcript_37949/g.60944 Transcript_37949/m.60944 type:complete len:190 (-) Transcript_37949:947-1516(-)